MSRKIEGSEKTKNEKLDNPEKLEKNEKPEGQKKEGIKSKVKNFFEKKRAERAEAKSDKEQGKETKEKPEPKQDSKNERGQEKERKSWELTPEQKKEFDRGAREVLEKYRSEQVKKSGSGETGSENDSRYERVREHVRPHEDREI